MQAEFVSELFALSKEYGIHTALDTSGATFSEKNSEKIDKVLDNTDLVMLDIKHIDSECHKKLTGVSNENILKFAKHLEKRNIPLWIRHVVIEGYTDDEKHLTDLGKFIGGLKNLKALDVLPYHTLGKAKYKQLGIPYPLAGVEPTDAKSAANAKAKILEGVYQTRKRPKAN